MSLYISSLNSGSNGNCYYVGNNNNAILVDAGISCREVEKRMKRLELDIHKVKAIFVSHEHTDHTRGICGLVKKYRLPIYISDITISNCDFAIEKDLVKNFKAFERITIGELNILAFPKMHDAVDPFSFIVTYNNVKVGVFTDIGTACKNLVHHFSECHAAFLEANYDCKMLEEGNYPYYLKKRITGGFGHLSNHQALELFTMYKSPFLTHLILSHLSKNNNCPKLVDELFSGQAGAIKVIVASRFNETPVYCISNINNPNCQLIKPAVSVTQLAFSFNSL